jgi:hypothetical protein
MTELLLLRALVGSKEQSDHGWQALASQSWFVDPAARPLEFADTSLARTASYERCKHPSAELAKCETDRVNGGETCVPTGASTETLRRLSPRADR